MPEWQGQPRRRLTPSEVAFPLVCDRVAGARSRSRRPRPVGRLTFGPLEGRPAHVTARSADLQLARVGSLASVAIIGAGPHGLSVAAHLDRAGIDTTVFGTPMAFWDTQMPRGMLLRSTFRASSIASPGRRLTLDAYERATGTALDRPVTLEDFVSYGRWFAGHLRGGIDHRWVRAVEATAGGYRLTLDDGEQVRAGSVVVAAGIDRFAHIPQQFGALPDELVSHSLTCHRFEQFANRRVAVIGGGQSALEYAALIREAGASVTVLARASKLRWIPEPSPSRSRLAAALHSMMYPPTGVGPRGLNWLAALPDTYWPLPDRARMYAMERCLRPIAAPWLRPRLRDVRCKLDCSVRGATANGSAVRLSLSDGTTEETDHILLATGYRVDVFRYPFLAPGLVRQIQHSAGFPVLRRGLESSIDGLYFVGAAASLSFGPVMRFVVGSWYAGAAVADRIAGRPTRLLRKAYQ
jgi:hypothetical protein